MEKLTGHSFHIPVMGLAYTIDSPIKVGRYGISSVVSLVEDRLIEMMRAYYYKQINEEYVPIGDKQEGFREKRITDYLNLMNRIVKQQFNELKELAFEKGSDLVKYFEMLPENSTLKQLYNTMVEAKDELEKLNLQKELKNLMQLGGIDVNIMTKLDRNTYDKAGNVIENGSNALTAFKGYAESDLENSTIIFSAGMNPRLFNYMERFDDFYQQKDGTFKKKIAIKVSDYRSALIQGRYLAKKGLWVSEFRIESGLNCGGHAFATDGFLIGPILQEFKEKREELLNDLLDIYSKAIEAKTGETVSIAPEMMVTMQGGVGNAEEHKFLLDYYNIDRVGWGSPFLLVPEASTVDNHSLELLIKSTENDIELSYVSPLGVRFNYLKNNSAEVEKLERIKAGKPGSPCPEKYLESNTEFTEIPICTASIEYQKKKLEQIKTSDIPEEEKQEQIQKVYRKECLCVGLSNAAALKYDITFLKNMTAVTVCPGPNIVYFNRTASLQEMIGHIYGRNNVLEGVVRPDMYNKELQLYIKYFKDLVKDISENPTPKEKKYIESFKQNLQAGISYYQSLAQEIAMNNISDNEVYKSLLSASSKDLENIQIM